MASPPLTGIDAETIRSPVTASQELILEDLSYLREGTFRQAILIKIVAKGQPFSFTKNNSSPGRCLKFMAIDTQGRRIQLVAFGDLIENLCNSIEVLSVYRVSHFTCNDCITSRGRLDFVVDIVLTNKTSFVQAPFDDSKFPQSWFSFVKNTTAHTLADTGLFFDVIGRIVGINTYETQRGRTRKILKLIDDTNTVISVTIWSQAKSQSLLDTIEPDTDAAIIAVTALQAKQFNNQVWFNSSDYTTIHRDPDDPSALQIIQSSVEFSSQASSSTPILVTLSITPTRREHQLEQTTCHYVQSHASTMPEKFCIFGYVIDIAFDRDIWYAGCQTCSKKAIVDSAGNMICPKCPIAGQRIVHKYLLRAKIADWSSSHLPVTMFDSVTKEIIGTTANELAASFSGVEQLRREIMNRQMGPYIFSISQQTKESTSSRPLQYIVEKVEHGAFPKRGKELQFT